MSTEIVIPSNIEKIESLPILGEGGFSKVYKHEVDNPDPPPIKKSVAIKLLNAQPPGVKQAAEKRAAKKQNKLRTELEKLGTIDALTERAIQGGVGEDKLNEATNTPDMVELIVKEAGARDPRFVEVNGRIIDQKNLDQTIAEKNTLEKINLLRNLEIGTGLVPLYYPLERRVGDNRDIVVTEAIDGVELYKLLKDLNKKKVSLNKQKCILYIAQVCAAVAYVQRCGFVYGDIKPDNIRVRAPPLAEGRRVDEAQLQWQVVLVDYGNSFELDAPRPKEDAPQPKEDAPRPKEAPAGEIKGNPYTCCSAFLLGTSLYLAPEYAAAGSDHTHIHDESQDARLEAIQRGYAVDWWGIGVLAYEMFVGTNFVEDLGRELDVREAAPSEYKRWESSVNRQGRSSLTVRKHLDNEGLIDVANQVRNRVELKLGRGNVAMLQGLLLGDVDEDQAKIDKLINSKAEIPEHCKEFIKKLLMIKQEERLCATMKNGTLSWIKAGEYTTPTGNLNPTKVAGDFVSDFRNKEYGMSSRDFWEGVCHQKSLDVVTGGKRKGGGFYSPEVQYYSVDVTSFVMGQRKALGRNMNFSIKLPGEGLDESLDRPPFERFFRYSEFVKFYDTFCGSFLEASFHVPNIRKSGKVKERRRNFSNILSYIATFYPRVFAEVMDLGEYFSVNATFTNPDIPLLQVQGDDPNFPVKSPWKLGEVHVIGDQRAPDGQVAEGITDSALTDSALTDSALTGKGLAIGMVLVGVQDENIIALPLEDQMRKYTEAVRRFKNTLLLDRRKASRESNVEKASELNTRPIEAPKPVGTGGDYLAPDDSREITLQFRPKSLYYNTGATDSYNYVFQPKLPAEQSQGGGYYKRKTKKIRKKTKKIRKKTKKIRKKTNQKNKSKRKKRK